MKVKIENVKTKVVKEIKKELATDYLGTGDWVMKKDEPVKEVANIKKINIEND